ncbi:MAG TPA: peptidoglycan DD-metalloendopeptidase family protein [Saprospiraceae bacterium]|nr:peptidoglycan DD-metalloendopeptidase family protein [Saprospiraceae bacterium]HPN71727.1 peptidoglycan DD-metalloendopeptidase family protein [Saprospiraceae bacterium]
MKLLLFMLAIISISMVNAQNSQLCVAHNDEASLDAILNEINNSYLRSPAFINFKKKNISFKREQFNHVTFEWPLRANFTYQDIPNYFVISNYVDLTPEDTTIVQDYLCGTRTYDKHRGIDITLFPFSWHMMEKDYVQVLAAADGIVQTVRDTFNNDYNCQGCKSDNDSNNRVILVHADGSKSIYYHIKTNSVLVDENQIVKSGEPIAFVASSGCSFAPHLHFEVRDSNNNVVEPFWGICNNTTSESWWDIQKPYWVSEINRVMCHSNKPTLIGGQIFPGWCEPAENMYPKNDFAPGDSIYYGIAVKDILQGGIVEVTVTNPNGLLIFQNSYNHGSNQPFNAFYLSFPSKISPSASAGVYKIAVSFVNKTYVHYFTVNCQNSYSLSGIISQDSAFLAAQSILSSQTLGSLIDAKYQAGNYINLIPGFHAQSGALIAAQIRSCNFSH